MQEEAEEAIPSLYSRDAPAGVLMMCFQSVCIARILSGLCFLGEGAGAPMEEEQNAAPRAEERKERSRKRQRTVVGGSK